MALFVLNLNLNLNSFFIHVITVNILVLLSNPLKRVMILQTKQIVVNGTLTYFLECADTAHNWLAEINQSWSRLLFLLLQLYCTHTGLKSCSRPHTVANLVLKGNKSEAEKGLQYIGGKWRTIGENSCCCFSLLMARVSLSTIGLAKSRTGGQDGTMIKSVTQHYRVCNIPHCRTGRDHDKECHSAL